MYRAIEEAKRKVGAEDLDILLLEIRDIMQLSQKELVKAIGITEAALSAIENNKVKKPRPATMHSINKFCETFLKDFFPSGVSITSKSHEKAFNASEKNTIQTLIPAIETMLNEYGLPKSKAMPLYMLIYSFILLELEGKGTIEENYTNLFFPAPKNTKSPPESEQPEQENFTAHKEQKDMKR